MRFKPHDHTKPYRRESEAQRLQRRLFRVRGLYYHSYALTGWRAKVMRLLVDAELKAYGAETQTWRHCRTVREMQDEMDRRDLERHAVDLTIPF